MPRMADFAEWGYSIAEAIGIGGKTFMDTYQKNIELRNEEIIDANPVARVITESMRNKEEWKGTSSKLLAALEELAPEKTQRSKLWPKAANVLTRRINELKTNLGDAGIKVESGYDDREKYIELISCQQVGENAVVTVATVASQQNQGVTCNDTATICNDTAKIPLQPNSAESLQNNDNNDNNDIFPTLLGDKQPKTITIEV